MLSLRDLSYTFPGNLVRALSGVRLDFHPGQIHAVIGENGAGKSTLARICTGHLPIPTDSLFLDDTAINLAGPVEGIAHGLALVPQHPRLAPSLLVWQNLLLGVSCGAGQKHSRFLSKRGSLAELRRELAGWEIELPLESSASKLDASRIHWTVIAEALLSKPRYLFLDEPSAPYGPDDVGRLYGLLRRCTAAGMGVIVITHRLQEVIDYADQIHILRHGVVIESLPSRPNLTKSDLLGPMFGESEPANQTPSPAQPPLNPRPDAKGAGLEIKRLSVRNGPGRNLQSLDLIAPPGRITGIIGMKDQGLEILEDLLAGVVRPLSGHMLFEGKDLHKLTPLHRGYIPGRRFQRGIAPGRTIGDNAIVRAREALFPHGWISTKPLDAWFAHGDQELFGAPNAPVITLSGGMIQRLIFQRELDLPIPRLVIAAEPFWGLDRHFQTILQHRLLKLAELGSVVIFISSDLDDAIDCCDSLTILHGGRLVHTATKPLFDRAELAMKLVQSDSGRQAAS